MASAYVMVWYWYYILLGNFLPLVFNAEQRFAREPQDQTAVEESSVILPCRVINLSGGVQWTKDGFALGNHRNLSEYERYKMIGTDEEGDFSLEINPVRLIDDSNYQCQVSPGKNNERGIRSRTAFLTVLIPPKKPEILQGSSLITTEGREIELECVSKDGKPAAELIWIDGLGNVVTNKVEFRKEVNKKLETASSVLKITPKKRHHNTTFKCQAQNSAEKQPQTAEIKLFVKYAPKVTIKIVGRDGPGQPLLEGTDVKVICDADANPSEVSYRWTHRERLVYPTVRTEFVIHNITRADHDSIIKCEVENDVGKSEDSETLYVTYGPRLRQKVRSFQEMNNTPVTLSCDVDANPAPMISWIYEKTNTVVSNAPNYTMILTPETSGRYFCKAETAGFSEIVAEAAALMKGPPIMKPSSIQYGVIGEPVRLECVGYSVPEPREIFWTYNGQIISTTDNSQYEQKNENDRELIRSILIIEDSRQEHYGNYNCSMRNEYGLNTELIILKSQKGFPILLAFAGAIGGVVIVVAAILILILCRKKVKKFPPPPPAIVIDSEKHCKDSDRSSNISDIKLEIRTGSSASNTNCDLDYNSGGGHDSDSIITRIATSTLPSHMPLDHRFSINRYSSADYPEPIFPPKSDGHNNNGYVPYVDYSRDYNPPPVSLHSLYGSTRSPSITAATSNHHHTSTMNSLDLRYPSYASPHLRNSNSPSLPPLPATQPPPPPYCTLRNGSVPHVSKFINAPSSQYIVANASQQAIIKKGSLATHV